MSGFERVIEAGLGKGPQDPLGIALHTFPATRAARTTWPSAVPGEAEISQAAHRDLLAESGDRCGIVSLAGRVIGAPFVGALAAGLVVAEPLRLGMGAHRHELVSCDLGNLDVRTVIAGDVWPPFNPGAVEVGEGGLQLGWTAPLK